MGQLGVGSSMKSDFYKNPMPITYFNVNLNKKIIKLLF